MHKFEVEVANVSMYEEFSSDGADAWTLALDAYISLEEKFDDLDDDEYERMLDKFSFMNELIVGKDIRTLMDPDILRKFYESKKASEDISGDLEFQSWENAIELAIKNANEGFKPLATVGDLIAHTTIEDFTLYLNDEDKKSLLDWVELDWDSLFLRERSETSLFETFGDI